MLRRLAMSRIPSRLALSLTGIVPPLNIMYLYHLPSPPSLGRLVLLAAIFLPVPGSANQRFPQEQERLIEHARLQDPLVSTCSSFLSSAYPRVVCIRRYSAVMPGNFSRKVSNIIGHGDTYRGTSIPADASFSLASQADFLVFDEAQASEILGPNPMQEFVFELPADTHEGPVFIPASNELYISRLGPQYLPQLVVDLNSDPPVLFERTATPPIYAGAGARYQKGMIYYAALGGHEDLTGQIFRPGIYTLNTTSGKSTCLLNNYYGYYFNSVDDLDLSPSGDIWFTDNGKSILLFRSPSLQSALHVENLVFHLGRGAMA